MGVCKAPSSFCVNCCKVDNAFLKADLCFLRTVLEPWSTEATSYSCRESILVGSNGGYDLHPQEHPIFGKDLRLDYFHSFVYGILDLV